jgi:hypothetical protein
MASASEKKIMAGRYNARPTNPPARRQTAAGASRVAADWRGLQLAVGVSRSAEPARPWHAQAERLKWLVNQPEKRGLALRSAPP